MYLTNEAFDKIRTEWFRTKEERLFRIMYKEILNAIHSTIKKTTFIHSGDEYKDAISLGGEVFLKCLNNYDISKGKSFTNYFIFSFRFKLIDYHRKYFYVGVPFDDNNYEQSDINIKIEDDEKKLLLKKNIEELTLKQQVVINCLLAGMSGKDIASVMCITPSSIANSKKLAIKTLKSKLRNYS